MEVLYSTFGKRNVGLFIFALLGICFLYLLYLPADHFDEGQTICLSVLLANTECYACGMTRGIQHILHGEFQIAWEFNKLSFVVLQLAVFMTATSLYTMFFTDEKKDVKTKPK